MKMAHFKEDTNPLACIFGSVLNGDRNKESPPQKFNFIKIFGFFCEIKKECEEEVKQIASNMYKGLELYGTIPSSMSGKRGIIEPADGYKSAGFITKRKPKKVGTHTVGFQVEGEPAVCYFDNLLTRPIIKLAQIRAKVISKR